MQAVGGFGFGYTQPERADRTAFYAFADVTALLGKPLGPQGTVAKTSADFASALLDEAHVAAVPGDAFGAPGYLRFSYALADAALAECMKRMKAFVEYR